MKLWKPCRIRRNVQKKKKDYRDGRKRNLDKESTLISYILHTLH